MKVKALIEQLKQYEDFVIEFSFIDGQNEKGMVNVRTFANISIGDIGHSEKIIKLDGEEIT